MIEYENAIDWNDVIYLERHPSSNEYDVFIQNDSFTGDKTISVMIKYSEPGMKQSELRYFKLFSYEEENDSLSDNKKHYNTDLIVIPMAEVRNGQTAVYILLECERTIKKSRPGPFSSLTIRFSDGSQYSPQIDNTVPNLSRWFLSKKEYEMLIAQPIKALRLEHTDGALTDFFFEGHFNDYKHLSKDLPFAFQEFIKKSVSLLEKNTNWVVHDSKVSTFSDPGESFENIADYCYVYLMVDRANHLYKIGMSNRPEYRESTLQGEKPSIEKICDKKYPSRKIASVIESSLHKVFDSKRVRGEWFRLDPFEVWQIKEMLK